MGSILLFEPQDDREGPDTLTDIHIDINKDYQTTETHEHREGGRASLFITTDQIQKAVDILQRYCGEEPL